VVRTEDLDVRLARHHDPLGVVAGSLAFVLHAGTPLRRVAAVLAMSWSWAGVDAATASYYSVRLWLLRLGLYQLNRPKEHADDWMGIVDHTLQIGDRKCLIDLQPVTESNGRIVYRQLQAATAKTGVPRAIVSDNGPDLHSGIERFRRKHRGTIWSYDIKHKTACLLKHALQRDASWRPFVEQVHRFKQKVSFTALAGLAPPQQRSKARYMNVDVLTNWAAKHLKLLDLRKAIRRAGLKPREVETKLGWLRKFAPQIRRWEEMLSVSEAAEHYVRHEGIHSQAGVELAAVLPRPLAITLMPEKEEPVGVGGESTNRGGATGVEPGDGLAGGTTAGDEDGWGGAPTIVEGERRLSKVRIDIGKLPWENCHDVYNEVIQPLANEGAELYCQVVIIARGDAAIRENTVELGIKESLSQREIGADIKTG